MLVLAVGVLGFAAVSVAAARMSAARAPFYRPRDVALGIVGLAAAAVSAVLAAFLPL